jgi:hypothetical protein
MQLFRHKFPAGCEVRVITTPDGEVQVTVATARPVPSWLWGENATAESLKKKHGAVTDEELSAALMKLVGEQPGRGFSYYTQLSPEAGGPRASQQRRERVLQGLIQSGSILSVKLAQPVRRTTHVLCVS